jgi:hypothetical protein
MYVVVAQGTDGQMSVYGSFMTEGVAEAWADQFRVSGRDIELTVLPVLDPRPERRQGQRASIEFGDAIARHFGR